MVELSCEERVVAKYAPVAGRDEGSCCISALVLTCIAHEPPIQQLVTAAEARDVVARGVEALGAGEAGDHVRSRSSRRRAAVSRSTISSASRKRVASSSLSAIRCWSASTSCARVLAARRKKSLRVSPTAVAAALSSCRSSSVRRSSSRWVRIWVIVRTSYGYVKLNADCAHRLPLARSARKASAGSPSPKSPKPLVGSLIGV